MKAAHTKQNRNPFGKCFSILVLGITLFGFSGAKATENSVLHLVNDAAQGSVAKAQALEILKKARDIQQEELEKIDKELTNKISESQSFQVNSPNAAQGRANESKWSNYSDSLRIISAKRQEGLLKQKMTNQLMFLIDTKWKGQNMRQFLEQAFLDMTFSELSDGVPDFSRALFYTYMSVAVREIPEKTEDLISFVVGYMNFSTLTKPKPPIAYLNSRNYSNGSKSFTAHTPKPESLSQMVEKRLKIVEELKTSNAELNDKSNESSLPNDSDDDFDDSKIIRTKKSDQIKPSASIINFAPNKVSEVLLKD